MVTKALTVLAIACALAVASPAGAIIVPPVYPFYSDESVARYPRLTTTYRWDDGIRERVNAILSRREEQAHEDRAACFDLIRDAGRKPGNSSFRIKIEVRYFNRHFLSLDVRRSYDCAGPYPNINIPEPLTIDLTTGKEVNWTALFKPGVWPAEGSTDQPPGLHALYRARYAEEGGRADPECRRVVRENLGNLFLRLDNTRGLMMQPDFPHALQACADEIAFARAEILPHIADAKLRSDFAGPIYEMW
jgi:hypothetical protein